MDVLTTKGLKGLLERPQAPCVSLFLTGHGRGAERDRTAWKNLLREAEEALVARGTRGPDARDLLAPARAFFEGVGPTFGPSTGLAAFLSPAGAHFFTLPIPVAEECVVAPRPHVRPLLSLLSGDGPFYVLALSGNAVRLFGGARDGLAEVELAGAPQGLEEALRTHDRDEPLTFHTHPGLGLGRKGAIFHGHGVGIDNAKDDLLLYFRKVDRAVQEALRRESAPLVLAAVEALWPIYRAANTYAHLLEQGVPGCPDRLGARELHERAWPLVRPRFEEPRRRALALYARLAGTGRTCSCPEVVGAAAEGRLEALFVPAGTGPFGSVDPSGAVLLQGPPRPRDEDLANRAAIDTFRHGGAVYLVKPGELPGEPGLAGTYWLPLAHRGKGT